MWRGTRREADRTGRSKADFIVLLASNAPTAGVTGRGGQGGGLRQAGRAGHAGHAETWSDLEDVALIELHLAISNSSFRANRKRAAYAAVQHLARLQRCLPHRAAANLSLAKFHPSSSTHSLAHSPHSDPYVSTRLSPTSLTQLPPLFVVAVSRGR